MGRFNSLNWKTTSVRPKIHREITTLRTIFISAGIAVFGILLLIVEAYYPCDTNYEAVRCVIKELGGIFVATGTVAVLWELAAKRAFFEEILDKVKLADEVRAAGITSITNEFYRGIDWPALFGKVKMLDIFFSYGQTWRHIHTLELKELANRDGAQIRVILPDPDSEEIVKELARRFDATEDEVKKRIKDASDDFQEKFRNGCKASCSLWYIPLAPLFSFYRFDDIIILSLFKHRSGRGGVPAFEVQRGGSLYEFIDQEIKAFIDGDEPLARCIFRSSDNNV